METSAAKKNKSAKILVIRLSALGDVAMTLPAIYSFARCNPEMNIEVLTRPFFARIFINKPENVSVITADFKTKNRGFIGMVRLFLQLRKHGYTCVADLHNVSRSWILDWLFRLTGVRVLMVDKMREGRKAVLCHHGVQPKFTDRYMDVFRHIVPETHFCFTNIFDGNLPDVPMNIPRGSVGIAPFARYATKTYPPELMEQVVKLLTEKGVPVFLFGGRGREAETLQAWAAKYSGCTSVAGRFDIETELALMAHLTLMVAMDSANQHLASLCGVRVLTLWGGTSPACGFTAYGQKAADQLCLNLDCQPCSIGGSPDCRLGTLACLKGIAPEEVADRVITIIRK